MSDVLTAEQEIAHLRTGLQDIIDMVESDDSPPFYVDIHSLSEFAQIILYGRKAPEDAPLSLARAENARLTAQLHAAETERDSWRADAERLIEHTKHLTKRIVEEHDDGAAQLRAAEERERTAAPLIAAALELSRYDDWSLPRSGCPQCDPEEPDDWNEAREAFGGAVSDYLAASSQRAGDGGGTT